MIYLFNESKTLFSIVSREELLSFLYEREVNALYQASVEMPVQSTDKTGLTRNLHNEMQKATYFGHYDLNDKFQLHKIVSIDVTGDSFITTAVHLFFDEAKALAVTEERRFIDRPIEDSVIYAFGLIGWTLGEYDISDAKTVSFFNDTVLEAQAKIIKTFGFKFDYWLDFDGQKITSKKVKVKEELGTQTHQRYVYGHNTLGIKMETDFSEIYTAVLGRGHGERIENLDDEGNETEDTFGRRIEFDEVEWSKSSGDPLDKDLGDRILVDPDSTQIFGYVREDDTVAPRVKVVEFSDIEDKEELLQASYEWLMENNSPKAVYSVEVLETEELDLGDEVYVVYRDIDFVKSARVSRVVDDLLTDRRAVEFGDSDYFRRNSETSRLQRELHDTKNDSADYIQDLKRQANARIDAEMQQARDDFEQAWIEAQAEIDAIDERMSTEIANEIASFETEFNLEVQAAKDLAAQQIADTEQRINTTIDTTRNEMEFEFDNAVAEAREYAEQQAEQHADVVRGELNTFAGVHSQIVQELESDVMSIDDFLGSVRDITLDERLQNINRNFEERIRNVDSNTYNMLRETRFDNSDFVGMSGGTIGDDESIPYYRNTNFSVMAPWVSPSETVTLESGTEYILSFDFKSESVPEADYVWFNAFDGGSDRNIILDSIENTLYNLPTDGVWRRVYIRFTAWRGATGRIRIGSRFSVGDTDVGEFRIRLPYLTSSSNKEWVYHPLDATQSIEEVTRRITNLEDGRQTLITRSEYDFDTGKVNQTIADMTETVDTNSTMIANIEDYDVIKNGSLVMQTVDGFDQKVWLNDVANIGANLIPQSSNAWENGRFWSSGSYNNSGGIRTKDYIEVIPGEQYTFQDNSLYVSAILEVQIVQWDGDTPIGITHYINRGSSRSFTAQGDRIRIGLSPLSGFSIPLSFIDHIEGRIKMKLEVGDTATPMLNAISRIEQVADRISMQVQELDGEYVRQSDITVSPSSVRIGSTEILGDDVLSSILNVSPNAIDMITQKMRLSGDLYVDGDITALAITAIEGNFANLLASNIDSVSINAGNITTGTLNAYRLAVNNVLVNRLFGYSVFANEVTAKAVDAIEGNFARLFASEIETVDLNASNITTGTLSSARLQVNNALINRLISNSILTSEMRAQSLTAVRGDIADLRTRILTSDVIISEHINVTNALIDKMFASSALISRLTSKSAFISQIQTIDLTADQVRVGFNGISSNVTINSSGVDISGGALTIRRPDGAVWMQNGIPRYQLSAQVNQFLITGSDATWTGSNYRTSARSLQTVANIYTIHEGRYLDVHVATNLTESSSSASVNIEVQISGFGYTGASSKTETVFALRGGSDTHTIITIDMGVPTYNARQFYVRFGLASDTSSGNNATMRINRAVVRG